ncbi:MAG: hypothetical protein V1766_10020 [Pseudomonadota bacterium]
MKQTPYARVTAVHHDTGSGHVRRSVRNHEEDRASHLFIDDNAHPSWSFMILAAC